MTNAMACARTASPSASQDVPHVSQRCLHAQNRRCWPCNARRQQQSTNGSSCRGWRRAMNLPSPAAPPQDGMQKDSASPAQLSRQCPSPGLRCALCCGRSPGIAVTPGRGRLQEGPPPPLLRAAGPTDQSSCWVLLRAALSTQLRQPASQHWLRPRLYLQRKIKVLSGLNGQTRAKPRRKEVVSAEH